MLPLLSRFRVSPIVEPPYRIAILWGDLRGAITLALAVTENPLVPAHIKREVGILATGYVLFKLFVQGTTLRRVIRKLDFSRLSPLDLGLVQSIHCRRPAKRARGGGAITRERIKAKIRPKLDLVVHKTELVRQFPLFEGMEDYQRLELTRTMVTLYTRPGEVLKNTPDRAGRDAAEVRPEVL